MALALGFAGTATAGPLPPIPITPIFPPWSSGPTGASLPATITGVVTNSTGDPIPGASVVVSGDTSSTALEAQSFVQSAVTGADGSFVITDIIQGTYRMTINGRESTPTVLAYSEAMPWYDASWMGGADTSHHIVGGTTVDAGTIQLKQSVSVSGHALIGGATPVANSQVTAEILDGDVQFMRWATTNASGYYAMDNAPSGNWSIKFSGSGSSVPSNPQSGRHDYDTHVVTESAPQTFSLAPGGSRTEDAAFALGQRVICNNTEYWAPAGTSFQVGGIFVTATSTGPDATVYSWSTDDKARADVYLPAGEYHLLYHDDLGVYLDQDMGTITAVSGGTTLNETHELSPAPDTYGVWGTITEAGGSDHVQSWILAEAIDPSSPWPNRLRLTPSNGTSDGRYLIRLPANTGYAGNQVKITAYDLLPDTTPSNPLTPTHTSSTFTVTGPSHVLHNIAPQVGGRIEGTVHDSSGTPVPGVGVGATRLAYSPIFDGPAWTGEDNWSTLTDSSGHYVIGGLPANADYKVNFTAYYDDGMPLPIQYADYYRRTWHGRPLLDGLNTSATPVAVDHDSVSVSLGTTTTSVDETISPGGYVVLHADGPEHPTGAVYCDVMYQVGSSWVEIDSGFTTGGTFHKDWKVLPTGHYRVDYSDYFGRGGGSWTFDLGAGDREYTSVLVPAPIEYMGLAPSSLLGGAFGGLIDGGLENGGTGGGMLHVQQLPSMPATAPPLPSNLVPAGGTYNFSATDATFDGTWSLRMPYSAAVPSSLLGNLRVRHLLDGGTVEVLTPFTRNTTQRTLQVQASSLSPFQVVFQKVRVTLGKPAVPSKIKRKKRFTVTGTLAPAHNVGAKSVKLTVYKLRKGKWRKYASAWAKNYNYRGITQYRGSLTLPKGSYRIDAYVPADTWHYAVKSRYRQIKIK